MLKALRIKYWKRLVQSWLQNYTSLNIDAKILASAKLFT